MEVLYVRYRILISDDEVDIVEMLTGFFRSKGYEVFSAYNGVETLKLAELQPDIILLDINMPKLDGMEVCKKIRDYVSCPILFLTARIEENDKVQGFSVGGDDYIVKPFSLVELEARVQAHLRREERHQTNTKVKFSGELLIDYSERTVYIQNQPIGLVKKEFDNINIDLMIGLPNQKILDIKKSLEEIIKLNPNHVSVYSLILEEGTVLYLSLIHI